jgi:hypothetical protein
MKSSDLFSHPPEPERVAIERNPEPVEAPIFSDAPASKSTPKTSPS